MTTVTLPPPDATGPRSPCSDAATSGAVGSALAERARRTPEKTLLRGARVPTGRSTPRTVTFGQLAELAEVWDRWLGRHGLGPGARIGVAGDDPVDTASLLVVLMATGRWAVVLDPTEPRPARTATLDRLHPAAIIGPRIDGRPSAPPHPEAFTVSVGTDDGGSDPEDPGGSVLSSSGTTGTPKTIPLAGSQLMTTAELVAGHLGLGPGDVGFHPLPLFHVNAQVVGVLSGLVRGAEVVLDDRFHRNGYWEVVARAGATWINAVPAILARVADLRPDERVPEGIRLARSASAPLPVAVRERFEERTGIPVVETYGMTEAASQITANPVAGPRRPGSVGRPVGVELRIAPAPGLGGPGTGGVGHVEIRGPSVLGPDGCGSARWLRTGDLGHVDDDGFLYLVGRADDLINRGGEMISPRALEEVLASTPGVSQAVVVPEPHPTLGQVPVAFVVSSPSPARLSFSSPGPAADALVRDAVARLESVARASRPHAVHLVPALPVTATGKVRRSRVREASGPPLASATVS